LLQIGERGIHHAGARGIETTGQLLERLDDLVAMSGTLGEQRQNDELQIIGAELAAHENTASPEPTTVDEGRTEGTEVPSESAPRAAVVETETMHGRILSMIVRQVISYVLRYILSSPVQALWPAALVWRKPLSSARSAPQWAPCVPWPQA